MAMYINAGYFGSYHIKGYLTCVPALKMTKGLKTNSKLFGRIVTLWWNQNSDMTGEPHPQGKHPF